MMKRCFIAILSTLAMIIAVVSCKGPATSPLETIAFDSLFIDSVCPLFRNYDKPACHIVIKLDKPLSGDKSSVVSALEKVLVAIPRDGDLVGESGSTLEGLAKAYVHQYIIQYLLDGKEAIDSYNGDEEAASSWMNYEENVVGQLLYNADGIISYQFSTYSFSGGAHGNTTVRNCVFDCASKRTLALTDLFSDESLPEVAELMRQKLLEQYECATLDELSERFGFFDLSDLSVTENFYVDDKGVCWVFDPFEIASSSMEQIEVRIPWVDVKKLMRSGSVLSGIAEMYGF